MNEVQIHIVGEGYLDLFETTDFPLVINKSIANISDISARDSHFSYDFEIPNNANNNKILFGAEFVNATDKAILGKQDAIILLNGSEYERGFIEVKISKYLDKYVLNFFGGNAEWVELGSELLVKDLGFAPNLTTYAIANINAQNSGNASNKDYGFPLVDRNSVVSNLLNSRPVFYVKAFFERFFSAIGYTIESDFLNSKFVLGENGDVVNKGLAVDLATIYAFEESVVADTVVEVSADRSGINAPFRLGRINLNYPTVSGATSFISYTDFLNIEVSDEFNLWGTGIGYTAPRNGNYIINFNFDNSKWRSYFQTSPSSGFLLTNESTNLPNTGGAYPFSLYIPLIQLSYYVNGILRGRVNANRADRLNGISGNFNLFLLENDVITFFLVDSGLSTVTGQPLLQGNKYLYQLQPANRPFTIQLKSKIDNGDQYEMSSVIPKELKAMDFISDFKLLFNLYFEADVKNKTIKIEPRNSWKDVFSEDVDGYYKSVGLAMNWTEKIDLNFAPEINTEIPYNRTLIFDYKHDTDDKWLEQWEKNNNRVYGEHRQDLGTRFPNGETSFITSVLAPTIQGFSSGRNTSIMRTAFAPLNAIDATQPLNNNKYAPRIGWFVDGVYLMEKFNNAETFEGTNTKLTFNGVEGLVDKFWSKTLRNLINAVTLKIEVYLTKQEAKDLDFSKPIYLDAPQQIKGYYVVQSIESNVMKEGTSTVNLLYYKDYSPLEIDATQGTNISQNTQGQQTAPPRFVLYETGSGQLINVLDEDDDGNLLTLLYD